MRVAIITGASSGLGLAFAQELDQRGEADEIWAVARRADRLAVLQKHLRTPVVPLLLDLADPASVEKMKERLAREKPRVTALVNAAGFGKFGRWDDLSAAEVDGMLDVNVRALVHLTVAALPYMGAGSRLLEMASCAAFQPLPDMNVYAATKAFVLHYTRALRRELRGSGIKVTAVCPGWVQTEFMSVAVDTRNGGAVKRFILPGKPRTVARRALAANSANLAVATCAPHSFLQRVGAKIAPAWLAMECWKLLH